MEAFNNFSIRTRLAFIMGFMALMMLGGGAIGLGGIVMSNNALESNYKDRMEPTKMVDRIMLLMNENRAQIMLSLQHSADSPFAKMHDHPITFHTDNIIKNRDEITAIWEEYQKRDLTPEERTLAEKYTEARKIYVKEGLVPAREALLAGDYNKANEILLKKINSAYKEANAAADTLLQQTLNTAKADYDAAITRYNIIRNVAIIGTLIGILLAAIAGSLLARSIVNPLNVAIDHFDEIAKGNLSMPIESQRKDEIGRVLQSLSAMQNQLKGMIGKIVQASSSIENRSNKLNSEMIMVMERAENQRDRVQEVAAAMEEVSQSVNEVAASAENTANSAEKSQTQVSDSNAKMTKSVEASSLVAGAVQASSGTITELNHAIQKIGDIAQTIKEIADQTNLLALNAAIEAARAGESGRGFAVVADEVRKLAERTTLSTVDITATVSEIQQVTSSAVASMDQALREVDQGIVMMRESGSSLKEITTSSEEVADLARHIASAAKQQAIASGEVAHNMERISALVEENTAAAFKAEEVAGELAVTAEDLTSLVRHFRVAA